LQAKNDKKKRFFEKKIVALQNNPKNLQFFRTGYRHKIPVIGLTGIWGWMSGKGDKKLNPQISPYVLPGRKIYMIYDSDATDTADKAAAFDRCATELANALFEFGAVLHRVDLPKEATI